MEGFGALSMVDPTGKLIRSDSVSAADVQDEIVLLHIDRGEYFGMNAVGQQVWHLLEVPRSVDDLVVEIAAEYDAEESTIRSDITQLVTQLLDKGILVNSTD